EPPASLEVAIGTCPAATAADEPPDEPPGLCFRFHGLRVEPESSELVTLIHPYCGKVVVPIVIKPASSKIRTCLPSRLAMRSFHFGIPTELGLPSTALIPFTSSGTP